MSFPYCLKIDAVILLSLAENVEEIQFFMIIVMFNSSYAESNLRIVKMAS